MTEPSIEDFYANNELNTDFDHRQYQKDFPEVKKFYQPFCSECNIPDEYRLYFHYALYGDKNLKYKYIKSKSSIESSIDKTLYIKPTQGLANRLLFINSCLNFVYRYNFDHLKIFWTQTHGFSDIHFQEIFDTTDMDLKISFVDEEEYTKASDNLMNLENVVKQDTFTLEYEIYDHHLLDYISKTSFTFSSWICFEYLYPTIFPYDFDFIKSLKPKKIWQHKIDSYKIPDDCVGVHIRRGDTKYSQYAYRYQNSLVSSYVNIINNEIESKNIFLSTDCELTQKKVIQSCGDKNIIVTNKSFVEYNLTEKEMKDHQIDAAIDFFCLSKCKEIYGNKHSTFGTTASKLLDSKFHEVDIKNAYHYNNFSLPPMTLTVGIKNRFQQLKVALNSWIIQDAIKEILIVDWDSDDIDRRYLKKLDKRIKVLRVDNQPNYEHARVLDTCINNAKYDHILKMDVDYIINPYYKLEQWLDIDWDNQFMAGFWGQKTLDNGLGFVEHLNGFMCVRRDHVHAVGGYNKDFVGYGWEDCELYMRLMDNLGLEKLSVPISKNFVPVYHMPHHDYIRTKYQIIKDREESRLSNISKTEYKSL